MRLSDIIGNISHTIFVEIGLVLFLMIFAGAVFYAFMMSREQVEHLESMPLDDNLSLRDEG
ncbi:MAG: hypothetical protein CL920_08085 [Deltaproteobacteria bacterium]|nr:hypothetical protein [Deltaproteobacteria bacterium]MBU48639.1 hypothetical protein [Deltaproteobacteria bacterium]|tara:strand:+ start:10633 stop:10815 length:183 start_codon:yes stop_codon:yes gene_type:complete